MRDEPDKEHRVDNAINDGWIGATAVLLLQRGNAEAAVYLTSARSAEWTDRYTHVTEDEGFLSHGLVLYVPVEILELLQPDIESQISTAFSKVLDSPIDFVSTAAVQVDGDWRSEIAERAAGGPSNQASIVPIRKRHPTVHGLRFRDAAEAEVYNGLVRAQLKQPQHDRIAIAPNSGVRVAGHTWEPDFIVTFRKRVGIIHVDGASHHGKRASDKSQDRLYEDAGFAYVDRIDVADCTADVIDTFVTRFLRKLASS